MAVYATCFVTSLSIGFTLGGYNTAGVIIEQQKDWPHLYTILVTSAGVFGLMLGSLLCDQFMAFGRINTLYIANILIVLSVVPQMWLTVPGLMAGRFLLGFGGAMCCVSSSVFMAESVPAEKLGTIGTAVNTGIIFALLFTTII